jgi:hypothetical protein
MMWGYSSGKNSKTITYLETHSTSSFLRLPSLILTSVSFKKQRLRKIWLLTFRL